MPDLVDMSLAGPKALRAAVGFLGRLDDVEGSVAGGGLQAAGKSPGRSMARQAGGQLGARPRRVLGI